MSVSWMSTELRSDLTNHKSKQQSFRTLRNWGYQYLIIVPLSKRNSYSLLMVSYVLSPFNSRFLFHVILRKLINMVVEMQYIAVTQRRKHMWTIQGFMDAWLSQMLTTVMTVFYHVCVETCMWHMHSVVFVYVSYPLEPMLASDGAAVPIQERPESTKGLFQPLF